MKTTTRFLGFLGCVLLGGTGMGCQLSSTQAEPAPSKVPAATEPAPAVGKRVPLNKEGTLVLETMPDKTRRVRVEAKVVLRQGPLEMLLCRHQTKEHESILSADVDARAIHVALIAAGAKEGKVVEFQPKFKPPSGTTIRVTLEYQKSGKTVTVPARQWIRNASDKKDLAHDWVFAGSQFLKDPDDPAKPPYYAANSGDVICVANFDTAMLDLPVNSSKNQDDLAFEANTARIPPKDTKVIVILEPVVAKKDEKK